MTQKRIDLTQFEGNEKGWMYDVEGIGAHPKNYFEEVEEEFKDSGVKTKPLHLSNQEVNAITLLPELIAELKRCYEEIDEFEETVYRLDKAEDVLSRSGWYEIYWEEIEETEE
tara:strand:+ start:377 stop:715 length:339 start_codon:yes stop_codon:yes gene_type:complete